MKIEIPISKKIPKGLIKSKYRKEMWKHSNEIMKKIEKHLSISSAYLIGSFSSNKKRPSDVDLILLLKTKEKKNKKWALDIEIVPENKFGEEALEDIKKLTQQRYGKKNSTIVKLK